MVMALPSRICRITAAILAALLMNGIGAHADQRPAVTPTRDVDVVYQTVHTGQDGHDQVMSQRMRWNVSSSRLRVDPPTGGLYMIIEYRTHRLTAVRESERAIIEMSAGTATGMPGFDKAGSFRKAGSAAIAGLPCTEWDTRDSSGMATIICLTDDGVLLRATSGDHILVEAASVIYGPLSDAIFSVPIGYQRIGPPKPEASSP